MELSTKGERQEGLTNETPRSICGTQETVSRPPPPRRVTACNTNLGEFNADDLNEN